MLVKAPRCRKMTDLTDALCEFLKLDIDLCHTLAIGIMERLWIYASEFVQQGDIGKLTNARIAKEVGWNNDPDWLINTLQSIRWIDEHQEHRYIIHDWPEHCQDSVHIFLARKRLHFANGSRPRLTRLSRDERAAIQDDFARIESEGLQVEENKETHEKRTKSAQNLDLCAQKKEMCALEAHSERTTQPSPAQPSLSPALAQPDIKAPPLSPHRDGGNASLKIEIGKMPRTHVSWHDEWNAIKEAMREELPEEEFTPLYGVSTAVLGTTNGDRNKNSTLWLKGFSIPPNQISLSLLNSLKAHLLPHGIERIKYGQDIHGRG